MSLTIKKVQEQIENDLRKSEVNLPKLESLIFISHVLKVETHELYIRENYKISKKEYTQIKKMVQLKKNGMPTAYITNSKEFFGRNFFVNLNTLIPRPETEELIELILNRHKLINTLLDLGSGSGCIGITLALEIPIKKIFFSEINSDALSISQKNAKLLFNELNHLVNSSIQSVFICSNLFDSSNFKNQKFDFIVSNPPYVEPEEMSSLIPEVGEYEPIIALKVPYPNFCEVLLQKSFKKLTKGGWLYLENNPKQIPHLAQIMQNIGFQKISIHKDLSKKNRFVCGRKV